MKRADFRMNRRTIVQFLEYMVGGAVYFWSGYLIFTLCYGVFHWDWLLAKLAADVVGLSLGYLVQRYWAFNNVGLKKHEARTASKFGVISVINLAIDYLIIWGLKEMGVTPYIGFFISSSFFTVWNYLWYRFWVFYSKRNNKRELIHG